MAEATHPIPFPPQMSREMRIYRYMRQNQGWQSRSNIMHWTGCPSPKDRPIGAYVEFHNALDRLNQMLARHGLTVRGGIGTRERYRLSKINRGAA